MYGRERQKLVFVAAHHDIFARHPLRRAVAFGGKQGQLGQKIFGRIVARTVKRKLPQIFEPRFGVFVIVRQMRFIPARQNQLDLPRRIAARFILHETFEQARNSVQPAPRFGATLKSSRRTSASGSGA